MIMGVLAGQVHADALCVENPRLKVNNKVQLRVWAFDLRDVRLLDGPFGHAQDLDKAYLLSLDVDRLLHTFRLNAGLPSTAQPLGGWEEPRGELRGHFAGHYLSGCSLMYASTGDERLKAKADAVVKGLAECQAKLGSGYLSAYPETFFDRVEARQRVWAPYYTLHKIYAGLLDAYVYCDNGQALEVCKRFADWVIARNARLTDEQMQAMLGEEHGGMNEALANLYGLTGDERYLRVALRFNHQAVIGPAMLREDRLTGLHANTQFPKFIGAAREYELTGDPSLYTAASFFWDTVANERSYVIGGNSDGERFPPKERMSLALGTNTTETCNTYNMLRLTRLLFCRDPRPAYAYYMERAVYNHILASQHPENGRVCYFLSLQQGGHKVFLGEHDFTCCNGIGMENHARYGDSIYFHSDRALWVNLFLASELSWSDKGLRLRQDTDFPRSGSTRLTFTLDRPLRLAVHVRHPFWATQGLTVRLNGTQLDATSTPQGYATVDRRWQTGDRLEIEMPMGLRTEPMPDNPNRVALFQGPILLAGDVGPLDSDPFVPVLITEGRPVADWVRPAPGEAMAWHTDRVGRPKDVDLTPFYAVYDRRYSVYWDLFTDEQWKAYETEYRAEIQRLKELDARTVDLFRIGEMQPERDHNVQGERTAATEFGGRKLRHAWDGGWFSFDVAVPSDAPADLIITYWGSETGNRTFDVLVDGRKIATQALHRDRPERFWDKVYELPTDLTRGKSKVTVRFQAMPGHYAGGVFGVRVVKRLLLLL